MTHETIKDILQDRKKAFGLLGAVAAFAYIGIAGALDAHSEATRDASYATHQLEQSPSPTQLEDD